MKLLFILEVDILSHLSGGVQRITLNLRNYLLSLGGFEIDILILQEESDFSVKESFIKRLEPGDANNDRILGFIEGENYQKIINQLGFSYNDLIYRVHKDLNLPIVTVSHQCIACLFDKYSNNLQLNYAASGSFIRRFIAGAMNIGVVNNLVGYVGKRKLKREYQRVFEYSDKVIVYFEDFKEELLNLFGNTEQNKAKIESIPNILGNEFTTFEEIDYRAKEKRIIYVGRIEDQQKRVDKLVQFWESFSQQNKDYEFELLGNGPKFDYYKELINTKKLERIHFTGNVNPKSYYKRATFLILASDYEGHALVLTEAQKNGCIPVSFRCYSAIEKVIKNDINGIIVEDFSVSNMVEAFLKLTSDENRITRLQDTVQNLGDYTYPNDSEIVKKWQMVLNN